MVRAYATARAHFIERCSLIRLTFRDAFQAMRDSGLLAESVDVTYAVESTIALWDGAQMQWLLEPGELDVADLLERHLRRLTKG